MVLVGLVVPECACGVRRASGGRVGHQLTQGSAGRRSDSSTVTGEWGGPSYWWQRNPVMEGHGDSRVVWAESEDLETFIRKVKAYRLQVGDEKKAIGKALLGLGTRIGIMDSLTEADTSSITSLQTALQREFGSSARSCQTAFGTRNRLPGETYGMFLAALKSLFVKAFPGTTPDMPVAKALLKTRFLDGISSTVSSQLRLLSPDLDVDKLPLRAKEIDEAIMGPEGNTSVCTVGPTDSDTGKQGPSCPATDDPGDLAQLRAEVSELSRSVLAIQDVISGATGGGNGPGAKEGGAPRVFPPSGPAGRGRTRSAWRRGGANALGPPVGRGDMTSARDPATGSNPPEWQRQNQEVRWGRTDRTTEYGGMNRAVCWTCGESGHIQRFCTRAPLARGRGQLSPVVCWRCRDFGHTQYDCPLSLN